MSVHQHTAAGSTSLVVLAGARWPELGDDARPAPIAGFVTSFFPPLVAAVADRCLRGRHETDDDPRRGERTAVVLVSVFGDLETAAAVARTVEGTHRMKPLLFFQSVPNSIAGWVAAHWGLGGPVVCVSPVGDPFTDGQELAELLIEDGDADEVLLILADQAGAVGGSDGAVALLLSTDAVRRDDQDRRSFE